MVLDGCGLSVYPLLVLVLVLVLVLMLVLVLVLVGLNFLSVCLDRT